jgi:SAM-dependent methyltransferase
LIGGDRRLVGIDMNEEALAIASAKYPSVEFTLQTAAELPFPDESFDVVILSEVIEHVGEENKQLVIKEAHRVLVPGGKFLFTAPYQGVLAWLDPMDFKRRFSGVYKAYMKLTNYVPSTDIRVGHKHLAMEEIERLFGDRFTMTEVVFTGFLMPLLTWILAIDSRLKMLPASWHSLLNHFRGWESGVPVGSVAAFNVRIVARKLSTQSPELISKA